LVSGERLAKPGSVAWMYRGREQSGWPRIGKININGERHEEATHCGLHLSIGLGLG
jgi:hypothetical protein